MKRTSLYLCLTTSLLLLMACAKTPEPAKTTEEAAPTIQGVWETEEIETIGGQDAGINSSPQPGLYIFTKQHYSIMFVGGTEPRPLFKTATPSEKEITGAYNALIANAGTYELEGSNIVMHPSVAKDPNLMSGGSISFMYQLADNSLSLVLRPGQVIVPGIEFKLEADEIRYKLKRLE
jgi:hypothetical protein